MFLLAERGKVDDENNRKGIVNFFVRAIYLWDFKMTIILNGGGKPIEIDDILLDEIEACNAEFEYSSMVALHQKADGFL